MKDIFNKIISFGIKKNHSPAIAEKMKLVNGISFLGVPVCLLYLIIFGVTGFYIHAFVFLCGIVVFTLPVFINAVMGLKTARVFICIMAQQ